MRKQPPAASRDADGTGQNQMSGGTAVALLIGLPLAAAVLAGLKFSPLGGTIVDRYLAHPVEWVEVVMFCCALGALAAKAWGALLQRRVSRVALLPAWDGKPVPAGEAASLLAHLARLRGRQQRSWVAGRARAVLDFVC